MVKNIEAFSGASSECRPDRLRGVQQRVPDTASVRIAAVFPTDAASLKDTVEDQTQGVIDAVWKGPGGAYQH